MKKLFYLVLLLCPFLLSGPASGQIKTITSTVKQPFGGSQSPDDARVAAIAKAKREALEKAGTYLESLTDVKNNILEKDEIIAIAAAVLKVEVVSQKNYASDDAFGIVIVAKVDVDTGSLEKRVKALMKDRGLLKKYEESKRREKELLAKIERLESENKKLKSSSSPERRRSLNLQFRKAARKLTATEWNDKALALWNFGFYTDVAKARTFLKKAIAIDPEYSSAYVNMGLSFSTTGDYDTAIRYYKRALAIDLKILGPDHPKVARDYNNLGVEYAHKRDYGRAIRYDRKALSINLKILGPDHPNVATNYSNLGAAYADKGDYDRAIGYHKRALAIDLKRLRPDHPNLAIRYSNLGVDYGRKGDYDRAIRYYKKALSINLKRLGPDHPKVAIRYCNLGDAYKGKHEFDRALKYYLKALSIAKRRLGRNHQQTKVYQKRVDDIEWTDPFGTIRMRMAQ